MRQISIAFACIGVVLFKLAQITPIAKRCHCFYCYLYFILMAQITPLPNIAFAFVDVIIFNLPKSHLCNHTPKVPAHYVPPYLFSVVCIRM
jgi:hypothetical protein